MEIGKRFLEENSKYKKLNGLSAEEYLEKARTMFQEMDLQWDLDELDKIAAVNYGTHTWFSIFQKVHILCDQNLC